MTECGYAVLPGAIPEDGWQSLRGEAEPDKGEAGNREPFSLQRSEREHDLWRSASARKHPAVGWAVVDQR